MAMEQRASNNFSVKLGKTFTETLEMLWKAYGDLTNDALTNNSLRMVQEDESVEKIRELIRKDRSMSARLIEDVTGTSK